MSFGPLHMCDVVLLHFREIAICPSVISVEDALNSWPLLLSAVRAPSGCASSCLPVRLPGQFAPPCVLGAFGSRERQPFAAPPSLASAARCWLRSDRRKECSCGCAYSKLG